MTGWVWFAIFGGLAIVILAVGIPYLLTHKGMRDPHDTAEGQDYLQAKRRQHGRARTVQRADRAAVKAPVRRRTEPDRGQAGQ